MVVFDESTVNPRSALAWQMGASPRA